LGLSVEQIPQVIGKAEKARNGMNGLEGTFMRPMHVRKERKGQARSYSLSMNPKHRRPYAAN
jgi:hypothetical protein